MFLVLLLILLNKTVFLTFYNIVFKTHFQKFSVLYLKKSIVYNILKEKNIYYVRKMQTLLIQV